jgi:conjugal transfer ATP-binding protein TraC
MAFNDFSLGVVLKIKPLDISCASNNTINALHSQIAQMLNGCAAGLSLQFVQFITSGIEDELVKHTSGAEGHISTVETSEMTRELTNSRVAKFRELDLNGEMPRQNSYLLIRRNFDRPLKKKLFRRQKKKDELDLPHLEQEITSFELEILEQQSALSTLGIESHRVTDVEVLKLLSFQWNPSYDFNPTSEESTEDVRDQLCLTDVVIGLDHFVVGDVFHRVVSLKHLPERTFAGMAEALRALPFNSSLHLSVDALDQQREIASLGIQRRIAYSSVVGKKGVSDLDAQAKLTDIESMLSDIIQGREKVFKVSLNVTLRSLNEFELDSQLSQTLQAIRSLGGAEGMVETHAAFDIFCQYSLPNARSRERAIKLSTSNLTDLIPIFGGWRGHEVPNVLMRTREGSLFTFDPFSRQLTNSNMIVSGGSGAGKSYFTNSLLAQMLNSRPKVFILDIGGSYKKICENLGGEYVELGIKEGMSINPFSTDGLDPSDTENWDRKVKFLVALVELMTKDHGHSSLGRLEKAELEKLIQETLSEDEAPQLRNLRSRLLKHADTTIQKLGRILSLWCEDSPFGRFVDRPTTIEISKDFVCFDLKNLDAHPELQSVCLLMITDLIWREVQKDRTIMKFTVFDECWKILEDEAAAQFVGSVFRTFRKYRASAIAISQTIDDFSKSRVASAIMPNSSVKWILKQKGADQNSIQEALQLNEREMALIASLESVKGKFSESFLLCEDKRQIVRIESTPLEYWLFTTDPQDLALLERIKNEKPNLSSLDLLTLASTRYPEGAGGGTQPFTKNAGG